MKFGVRPLGCLFVVAGSMGVSSASAQVLAFPEAEGFGRYATGARANLASATVYHVTNLNDSGAGSLRDALSQSNRVVVFDVGGIINLSSVVTVASNIYIAGQTAPGGIGVYNNRVAFHGANNLISRYWSVRLGTAVGREDAASLVRGQNMIWDHMSITWGVDGTFDINPDSGQIIDNITIQNSAVAQGLDVVGHSTGGLLTIGQGSRSSIIKSLWADNVTRNPKVRGENEFINNVVYGYETSGYIMGDTTGMTSHANVMGNYFIEGPVDGSSPFASGTGSFSIYGNDNWVDGDKDGILDGSATSSYPGANVVAVPHAFPSTASLTAQQAVQFVMDNFGPNITRDAVDKRLAQEVASYGTLGGVIVRDSDLFPNYGTDAQYLNPRARLVDTDNDGMPDNWETSKGLNPGSSADWKGLNAAGYTRLEEYLNELAGYGVTRTAGAGGAWTAPVTWGGTLPNFAATAVVTNGFTHASGNAFARHANLDGSSTMIGGTLDVFDTATIGSGASGSLTISSGTMSAGRIMLGTTGRTGVLTLAGGTLQTGPIVSGGGTASLVLNSGSIRATGALNIAVPTTIGGPVTINTNGFSGSFSGGLSGSGAMTKTGNGALTLAGVNAAYSGPINLNSGTLVLATSAANSSTGTINAANGTTVQVTTSGASTPLQLASGATVTLTAGGLTYNGAISGPAGSKLNISNSSTGASNFSIGGSLANFSGTFSLGSSTGNIRIGSTGSASAVFDTGTSTGTLRSSNDGIVNFGALTGGASTKLQGSTNGTVATTYVIGALNTSTTFAGTITDGTNTTPGVTNITKVGTGTFTLNNSANSYTGVTTVQAGKLVLASGAKARAFSGGGADVMGGRLVLDYNDTGVSVASQVLPILDAGYDQATRFSAGQIRTSNAADPAKGLGWIDNSSTKQLTVAYTYYGDANLDGQVDITDLASLATAWQTSGNWSAGDFDYSGSIDITDLAAMATNWQAGVGAPLATTFEQAVASVGLGYVAVPEPATLSAVGLGLAAITRRRRTT